MRYRRALIPGASYFFTVNLADRSSRLLVDRIADLREVVRDVRRAHPFTIVAWVVLPDHLHAVWTLPEGDTDYATRWGLVKGGFSRRIPKHEHIRASRALKGERGIWQRRFWEHLIRDDRDLARHVDYIHYNPVKHGYVDRTIDWPYSTFHRDLRRGLVTEDWGVREDAMGDFGEAEGDLAGGVGVRSSPQPPIHLSNRFLSMLFSAKIRKPIDRENLSPRPVRCLRAALGGCAAARPDVHRPGLT